jgi:hypothetical protein
MFLFVRGFSRAARLPIGQRIRMATSRLLGRSHPTVVRFLQRADHRG